MTDKWKDILNQNSSLDPQKLMDYLEGKLSDKEKHEVESVLADSAFMDDAAEGLSEMKDKQKIASILFELNSQLHKKTQQRRKRQFTDRLPFPGWLVFTTVMIILLVVLAFIIYRMYTTAP
jgi:anti-sigma factor RsiW